ncbi:hypothetical protein EVAR_46362_1 [Eumeta japonica]|uniref:Uncharacterized protein n=1 Tax=Eumeta variegata TaxID=151549 RepID=A0A4C1WU53_EUMVA|nr:hypothetical protein EVAR_46362_1 [Eumeta japonica]
MTYVSPVFAHTAPTTLKKLQVLQDKFCRSVTNAYRCIKNLFLHRDLDLPLITKYLKDASEHFFSIAESHSNPLLSAAASYEAPPPYHFIRRPQNIIIDPPEETLIARNRLLKKENMRIVIFNFVLQALDILIPHCRNVSFVQKRCQIVR